ncbi:hypothetical protein BDR04DRAFT_1163799 [Suillus decipiens]|nr:hypothetical protein BDR04DRAFT_1163799 [Suillus decipiens]
MSPIQLPIVFMLCKHEYRLSNSQVKLSHFITYALHRTKLHTSVTLAALVLLQRLATQGVLSHCSGIFESPSFHIGFHARPRACSNCERSTRRNLEWELNVDPVMLAEFEDMVKDFVGQGRYPTCILPSLSKATPAPTPNPFLASPPAALAPMPSASYGHHYPSPPNFGNLYCPRARLFSPQLS